MTDETAPGWPNPVPPGPAAQPGQPPGQTSPASPQPFPPPAGDSQPGSQPYGQPGPAGPPPGYGQPYGQAGYTQPRPAGYQAFPAPPPGYGQPYGQPGYGQPGYGGWHAAPAPGGVPLRPLSLGDIFNGAVTLARRNPAATFGLTAIVMTVYGVVAALLERLYVSGLASFQQTFQPGQQPTPQQVSDLVSSLVGEAMPAILAILVVALISNAMLTGLLSAVIGRGILGHKVSLAQAWRAGRVGAVVGTTALLFLLSIAVPAPVAVIVVLLVLAHAVPAAVVIGVLGFIAWVVLGAVLTIRLSLALPAVVLERVPPHQAIRRSWRLSRGSYWRLFGILALTGIVVAVAGYVLSIPFLVGELLVGGSGGLLTASASTSVAVLMVSIVGSIVTATVTRPISAGVSVLLYADLRMRREGLDLMLRDGAQNQALTGDEFAAIWQPPTAQDASPAAW